MEQITIIGLVVLVLAAGIKEFFTWLGKKNLQNTDIQFATINNQLANINAKINNIEEQSKIMYEWHDKSDRDGVKIWYVRQSLEDSMRDNARAVETIAKNMELQTRLLEELILTQRSLSKEQSDILKDINDIKRDLEE